MKDEQLSTILVTGVGSIIGYGIVRSLRMSGEEFRIIGADIFPDAVGQYFCNDFVHSVPARAENYLSFLADLMARESVDLVFFGTEQEMFRASDERAHFPAQTARMVMNRPEVINVSRDKHETYLFLREHGLPTIPTHIKGCYGELSRQLGVPFLLKQRHSSASKGQAVISDEADFLYWQKKSGSEFMVQQIVGDDDHEYTVATFGFGDGTGTVPFVMRRQLNREGATTKAIVEEHEELSRQVEALTHLLCPLGPTNFQFRLHRGEYLLLEINPRVSSATSIRAAFGYNEALFSVMFFRDGIRPADVALGRGRAARYLADWVELA